MRKLYLHIGYPKTGTTSLQQHVFPKLKTVRYLGKYDPYGNDITDYQNFIGALWFSKDEALLLHFKKMIEFIGNRPILGYNLRFDLKFLDRYTKPLLGFSLPNQMIELSDLYRKSVVSKRPDVVPHLGFEEILDDLDVPIFGRHTALGDATTVAMAYIKLKRSR